MEKNVGDRGRKSTAALSIIPARTSFRPKPPDYLTPVQASEWKAIVARMPSTWFTRETHGRLIAYCRHYGNARTVAEQLDAIRGECLRESEALAVFDKLSRLLDREQRAMSSLATRMRITQGSRLRADKAATEAAKHPEALPRPWEI
jgi:phage terminase small subunit